MEHRQHDYAPGFRAEEHGVWKAAHPNTANIPVHDGKAFWILRRQANGAVDLPYEFITQTATALLVP